MVMKRVKFSTLVMVLAALFLTAGGTASAQRFSDNVNIEYKPTRQVKKIAKQYEKEGWKVAFGSMPMSEQLQRAIYFQKELDDEGNMRYAVGRGQTEAQYYDAARAQALELARLDIAGQFETQITAEAKTILGNEQGENLATVVQTTKGIRSLVSQNLKHTVVVTEIHKELPKGGYMVQISVAADRQQTIKAAKQAIRQELLKRGDNILKELDKNGWDK